MNKPQFDAKENSLVDHDRCERNEFLTEQCAAVDEFLEEVGQSCEKPERIFNRILDKAKLPASASIAYPKFKRKGKRKVHDANPPEPSTIKEMGDFLNEQVKLLNYGEKESRCMSSTIVRENERADGKASTSLVFGDIKFINEVMAGIEGFATNNFAESRNKDMNRTFGKHDHPWRFTRELMEYQKKVVRNFLLFQKVRSGKFDQKKNDYVLACNEDLCKERINRLDFLGFMANYERPEATDEAYKMFDALEEEPDDEENIQLANPQPNPTANIPSTSHSLDEEECQMLEELNRDNPSSHSLDEEGCFMMFELEENSDED